MFKCMDCGCVFEEPKTTIEYHGLDYGYESQRSCPNCGSTDYKDSVACDICGEEAWGSCYCENCKSETRAMLKTDFNYFIKQGRMTDIIDMFTEVLDDLYVEERSNR